MTTAQFAQVDPSTRQFPDLVRAVVAANLSDHTQVEGASVEAAAGAIVTLHPSMSQTDIQTRMNAAPAGSRLVFAPGTYVLTAPLYVMANNTHIDAMGATFQQTVWLTAGFDLSSVNGCLLDIGLIEFTGTRAGQGTSFRGSAGYVYGAGVWLNGDYNYIRNLTTQNMAVGVTLSSWNGTGTYDRVGVGNHLGHVSGSGANWGALWVGQQDLIIDDIFYHDDHDDSSGTNPTHVIYCSATTTFRSTGGEIRSARGENILTGQAFQLKFADSMKVGSLTARNCKGLLNVIDSNDLRITDMAITGSLANGGQGSVTVQRSVTNSQRLSIGGAFVGLASGNDELAVSIVADYAEIDDMVIETNHSSGVNTAISDVQVRGSYNRFRSPRLRSIGAGNCYGMSVGVTGEAASNTVIAGIVVRGQTLGVNVAGGSTGVSIEYDTTAQALTGTGPFIATASSSEQYSTTTAKPVALSTLGENPAMNGMAATASTVGAANMVLQVRVTPHRNITVSGLTWFSTVASGNYDIGIYDDASTNKLWSKGSTAWPAAGVISETVTGVTLLAGRTYRIAFTGDNTTGTLRALVAPQAGMDLLLDGSTSSTAIASVFPLTSTLVRGTSGSTTRIPLIVVLGS